MSETIFSATPPHQISSHFKKKLQNLLKDKDAEKVASAVIQFFLRPSAYLVAKGASNRNAAANNIAKKRAKIYRKKYSK